MKYLMLLIIGMFVAEAVFSREKVQAVGERLQEILEKNDEGLANGRDKEKSRQDYNDFRRREVRQSRDTFYNGRDTLYLLIDTADSLQRFASNRVLEWWRRPYMEIELIYFAVLDELMMSEVIPYIDYHYRMWMYVDTERQRAEKRVIDFDELCRLKVTTRAEFVAFHEREVKRLGQYENPKPIEWAIWPFNEYFYKVYLIIPRKDGLCDLLPFDGFQYFIY